MGGSALVCAGQGAQFVGMGKDLAEKYPKCRELFETADEALGYGLSKICFEGPEDELRKSNHCQPAVFVASMACLRAFECAGGRMDFAGMAGLSLGEWTALHAAGALTFGDTLRVLEARGRFMQEACAEREGAMVSVIGLTGPQLDEICVAADVSIANLNSEEQTVLSGERRHVEKAEQLAKDAGAKRTVMLNVAGAYHSALMASAAAQLREFLSGVEISRPRIPVVANVTGLPHGEPEAIRETMVRQVTGSVQWVSCVKWLKGRGVTRYIECGPGKVLTGLIKRIDRDAELHNIQDISTLDRVLEAARE